MRLNTLLAQVSMLGSASLANHIGYLAYETNLNQSEDLEELHNKLAKFSDREQLSQENVRRLTKHFKSKKVAETLDKTFENTFVPHFMQKIAQLAGNKLFGKYFGSALSSYTSSLAYMLFHKAMTAKVNYEIKKDTDSLISSSLPDFYQNKIRPYLTQLKENVFGIKAKSVNYKKFILTNGLILAGTFLDPEVSFPGTSDIAKANSLINKIKLALINKISYISIYFTYQASTMLMYGKKQNTVNDSLRELIKNYPKAIRTKFVPPLSISLADPLAELASSRAGKKIIPMPFLASIFRIAFMAAGGKLKAYAKK